MSTIEATSGTGDTVGARPTSAWQLIHFLADDSWAVERGVGWDEDDGSWCRLEQLAVGDLAACHGALVAELGRAPVLVEAEPDMWCAFAHEAWSVR
ncbi:MAG: hypothetical protein U0Q07_18520 [Acidimicrobiales bacterium]